MSDALQRVLRLVPLVRARPGIPVEDVARALGTTPEQVVADVDTLSMVGIPPFEPDDLVEITIEDGGVYVDLPQQLDRPVRLSPVEGAALVAAARAMAPGDPLVAAAVARIVELVTPAQRTVFDALVTRLGTADATDPALADRLREAARTRRVIQFDYAASTDDAPKRRTAHPRSVALADGRAYLSARRPDGEERFYRLDRMTHLQVTDGTFAPLPDLDVAARLDASVRLAASGALPRARLRFDAPVAAAVRALHKDTRTAPDGSVTVKVAYSSVPWIVSYALSWGGAAEILDPPPVRAAFAEAVRRLLDAHADAPDITPSIEPLEAEPPTSG